MGTSTATLIASLVAAAFGATSVGVNLWAMSRRERRDAHRKALEAELPTLADALHQVVATSHIQGRQRQLHRTASADKWLKLGDDAANKLEKVRHRVRYTLPGADIGLRNLTRMPSWTSHHGDSPEGQLLQQDADNLAKALHELIEASWRRGAAPRLHERRKVEALAEALRRHAPIGGREQEPSVLEESL